MKNGLFILFYLLAFFSFNQQLYGQFRGKNIPNLERKKFHFGASLGFNTTSYYYQLKPNIQTRDSVFHVNIKQGPGMIIQIPVISWNIHPSFHIRLLPALTFHETVFEYKYWQNGVSKIKQTRTAPTVINLPVSFKLSSRRINNFSAYAISGLSYEFDLSSQADVDQSLSDPIIKLKKHNFTYHVGGGFDFYLPYFKMGLDIKLSNGFTNLLIQDETFFSAPLDYLKSKVWSFSVTFEGSR